MKKLLSCCSILFFAFSWASAGKVTELEAKEVEMSLKANPKTQLVDVRTKEEFADGRIAGAVLIPWTDEDFAKRALAELNREVPVILICKSGQRSSAAGKVLRDLGFSTVLDLKGGMTEWQKQGRPILKN